MKKDKNSSIFSRALALSVLLCSIPNAVNANTLGNNSVYTLTSDGNSGASNVLKEAVYNETNGTVTYNYNTINLTNPKYDNTNVFGDATGETKSYNVNGLSAVARYSNADYVGKTANQNGAVISTTGNHANNIIGTFVNNNVGSSKFGGAVGVMTVKNGTGTIVGDFIGNYSSGTGIQTGGAILFENKQGGNRVAGITGNFIGNYAVSTGTGSGAATSGGAIQTGTGASATNFAKYGDITGSFIGNYVTSNIYCQGGAIDNGQFSEIGDINADFIRNYAESSSTTNTRGSRGGAINTFAKSKIGNITGDFIENYVSGVGSNGTGVGAGQGGAMYIMASTEIGNIKGNFYSNYAKGANTAEGGVIYNIGGHIADIGSADSIFNNNGVIVTKTSGTLIARGSVLANV